MLSPASTCGYAYTKIEWVLSVGSHCVKLIVDKERNDIETVYSAYTIWFKSSALLICTLHIWVTYIITICNLRYDFRSRLHSCIDVYISRSPVRLQYHLVSANISFGNIVIQCVTFIFTYILSVAVSHLTYWYSLYTPQQMRILPTYYIAQ